MFSSRFHFLFFRIVTFSSSQFSYRSIYLQLLFIGASNNGMRPPPPLPPKHIHTHFFFFGLNECNLLHLFTMDEIVRTLQFVFFLCVNSKIVQMNAQYIFKALNQLTREKESESEWAQHTVKYKFQAIYNRIFKRHAFLIVKNKRYGLRSPWLAIN